ncbi:uncharacterized protein LOC107039870 [Diachasma alloeum]|uniref:uncharacterized protein LOC107039870 n=1 Tax=Diachasma alloeum TaxID=454923 RepID=UPI0007381794|nr:uncharacterized protein LOC107039870 [Diachasma alloeum]
MSADPSESRGSENTPSLGKRPAEKPPFKLCFPKPQMPGRSEVLVSKVDANFVTPKFWNKETLPEVEGEVEDRVAEAVRERMARERRGPRDLYRFPVLSSQSYGWWYDETFGSTDPRFNFHRHTSDMVEANLMIQYEDKKLRGLCH